MKQVIIFFSLFFVAALFIVGLSSSETASPRTEIYQLRPAPTAGKLIGAVEQANGTYKWGSTTLQVATGAQYGTVNDTLSATGTYTIDLPVNTDTTLYQVFLTPVTALGHNINLVSVTDSSFTVKAWVNDTAANVNILKFHWTIKE